MNGNPKLSKSLIANTPWNQENHSILVASSLILRRNLAQYNFPGKLQGHEVEQVLSILKQALMKISGIENPQMYNTQDLSSSERELVCEHFLFLQGFQQPPNASSLFIDE